MMPVWEAVHEIAAEAGTNASQYVADLLAVHVGRADLVSDYGKQPEGVLPLAM